jgi:hypothetical protein
MEQNIIQSVYSVWLKVARSQNLQTITPSIYNRYKSPDMPHSSTIIRKTGKSWNQILQELGIMLVPSRNQLAKISASLHLLEKKIIQILKIGWQEIPFSVFAPNKKRRTMRPDSCCTERLYLQNNRLLLVDVKLSVLSGIITIYKYLPLFLSPPQKLSLTTQLTFFPTWLPEEALNLEPYGKSPQDGQEEMFRENNILYICYLVGEKINDILPGSCITDAIKGKSRKWKMNKVTKKLPENMEVRFVPFSSLPEIYARIAGQEYTEELKKSVIYVLKISDLLLELTQKVSPDTDFVAEYIYNSIKNFSNVSAQKLYEQIFEFYNSPTKKMFLRPI